MADSVRLKIYNEAVDRLQTITRVNGYNTQPRICATEDEAWTAHESVAIWLSFGAEEFRLEDRSLRGGQSAVPKFQVSAYVRKDAGDLIGLTEQAIQDVRNAMTGSYTNWQTNCDATLSGLETCETDEGTLAFDGRAQFTISFAFEYRGGPTW